MTSEDKRDALTLGMIVLVIIVMVLSAVAIAIVNHEPDPLSLPDCMPMIVVGSDGLANVNACIGIEQFEDGSFIHNGVSYCLRGQLCAEEWNGRDN